MVSDYGNLAQAENEFIDMGGIDFMPLLTPELKAAGFVSWFDDHITMLCHYCTGMKHGYSMITPFGYSPNVEKFQQAAVEHLKVCHPKEYIAYQNVKKSCLKCGGELADGICGECGTNFKGG